MLPHSLLLLVALFTVLFAEVKREEVDGILGSSVLLDPKVKVDHSKSEIIWEFIPAHRSAITISHYIPGKDWEAPSDHFKSRSQYTPSDASLLIKKLERTDQGEYRLTIDDQVVKIIQLHLFDELSEALILANSSSLGSTIQLTCNVSGDADEYQWWKDGRDISQHHQLIDQNRSLVIPDASRSDCGTYTCKATNRVSRIQTNYTLTFHDELSEALILANFSSLDSTIQLTCNVSGDANEYQWWKDGRDISCHHQLIDQNRSLVIPDASRSDCGTYTCKATNRVSHIQTNYTLTFHGFPRLEFAIIILSSIDLAYLVYVIACQYLHCRKTKLDKDMKRIKHLVPFLHICNVASLVAILVSIVTQGADYVPLAGLCSVSVQFLALILPFALLMFGKCMRICRKIRFINLIVCGLQVIVMFISIFLFTMVIHQNSCDSSLATWRIFFATRIGCAVNFILHIVFLHWKGKDTSGNIDTDKGQQDITECQQLKTTTPDDTAGSLPPD